MYAHLLLSHANTLKNVNIVINLSIGRQGGAARSVHGVGYDVVMQLMEPYLYKYHHLVCDNYFTSPALCSTLFDKDTYMTGTVRVYRKGMPKSLKGLGCSVESQLLSKADLLWHFVTETGKR